MRHKSTTLRLTLPSTIILVCLVLANLGFNVLPAPTLLSAGILDTFDRANGSIGASWSGYTSAFSVAANQLDVATNGYDTYIFWSTTSFGADQEAYITFSQVDADAPEQSLLLKSQNSSSYGNGVIEVLYDANADIVQVWTYHLTNGWVQHGANIPVVFANGDQFGAHALANGTIEVYKNNGMLATRSITTWPFYAAGGYIGLWLANSSDALLNNFGGGTVTTGPTNTPLPMTATNTSTPTRTPTAINTATSTSIPSATNTSLFTVTSTSTFTPIPTATATHTGTPTFTPTVTPTSTSTATRTPTSTSTATRTPTFTPTVTPTSSGFPGTTILDTFNRASGGIGTNWFGSTAGYRIASNRLDVRSGGAIFWTTPYNADQEIYVTITTVDGVGTEHDLLLKSQSRTTWTSGVLEVKYDPVNKNIQVLTYSSDQGWVQHCTLTAITLVNGNQFGARARANGIVNVYVNGITRLSCDVSAWTHAANGGYIGLWFINSGLAFLDNFGGGNLTATATNTPAPATATHTPVPVTITNTPMPPTATLTQTPTFTPTSTPIWTPTPTVPGSPTPTTIPGNTPVAFSIGLGGSDSIPHQIVRTASDHLYIFANQQSSSVIRVYRTVNPGLPTSAAAFASPVQLLETSNPISVDAVYDGGTIIHVLVNLQNRQVKDYPFDTVTNAFRAPITIATDGGTVTAPTYVGTVGVSGMLDLNGRLHVVYWQNGNHIQHRAFAYDVVLNTLTPFSNFTQVDAAGSSNHPAIAISPVDNSVTIAWVSEATNPARILARTMDGNGLWGSIEVVSASPVWFSTENGISIDQSPSLIIDSAGVRHLAYIQEFDGSIGDYGRIHYAVNNGLGWVDSVVNALTHDPALALNNRGELYIIGHGHPVNSNWGSTCLSVDDMCIMKKDLAGTWARPTLLIARTASASFDSSPSVKWSVAGFNRPEVIEFIFFSTPYDNPVLYYARIP
jgi:hypothetical protein